MSHVRMVCLVLLAAALAGPARGQDVEPVRITLHPAAAPTPALRYHLLPELFEMTPGNAAERYKQALAALKKIGDATGAGGSSNQSWMSPPAPVASPIFFSAARACL